jgi:hypothetical protein
VNWEIVNPPPVVVQCFVEKDDASCLREVANWTKKNKYALISINVGLTDGDLQTVLTVTAHPRWS